NLIPRRMIRKTQKRWRRPPRLHPKTHWTECKAGSACWGFLKLRLTLEYHMVLVYLRIHRADLPLTESVIQSVIDGRRRDAQSRSGDPVDHQGYRHPSQLLIGGHVFQFRQLLQPADE